MFACGWTSLVKASRLDIDDIIVHYKTRRKNVEIPECRKKIIDFYVKDNISRQLPYKNFTIRVKDENEIYQREAIRVMEVTLKKAYDSFVEAFPEVKISKRSFEMLRPKYVRLRSAAQRL